MQGNTRTRRNAKCLLLLLSSVVDADQGKSLLRAAGWKPMADVSCQKCAAVVVNESYELIIRV